MTTSGTKNQHFLCQMKMESEVACAHSVTLTKTVGLTIDKAGVVGAELSYTYPAGQGLVAQDVGILPTSCGDGKLFAAITSPYFVTPSGLKVKRDVIDIQVECEEPDGWKGTDHGFRNGFTGNPAVMTEPDLYYKHTHVSGLANISFVSANAGALVMVGGGATSGAQQTGDGQGNGWTLSAPGVYTFAVYTDGNWNNRSDSATITITVTLPGGATVPVSVARRGITKGSNSDIYVAWNTPIQSQAVIFATEAYRPGNHASILANGDPSSGISFSKTGFDVTATGQFLSPPSIRNVGVQVQLLDGLGAPFYYINGTAYKIPG